MQNGVWLKNGISITAIGIQAAMDAGDIRNGYNEISRKAARDHGLRISQLVNTDRKGGAFPIMLQQFRRAIGVAIVRGNARHKLSRLHYVRTTPEEAAATCRTIHSNNRWKQHQTMKFFPARTAVASDWDAPILPYVVLASRERSPTAKPKFGLPTSQRRRFCKIGRMAVLEKGMVFPNPLPDFANSDQHIMSGASQV